jgi:cell pole-organizing protein PopZ
MEDLLASIRKAIHEDIGEVPSSMSSQSAGTLYKNSMRELHVKVGDEAGSAAAEIQQLRERINRTRGAESLPPVARTGISRPAAPEPEPVREWRHQEPPPVLRQSYAEQELRRIETPRRDFARRLEAELPPPQPAWVEEEPAYQAPPAGRYRPEPQMLSHESAAAAGAAFNKLADTILSRATSERSIEDMTRDLLRGMLKQWLDDNLPALVERLVREEIERVARHGR